MRRIALLCAVVCLGTAGGAVAWGHTVAKHPASSHTTRRHKAKSRPKHKRTTKRSKTSSSTTQTSQTVKGTQSAAASNATSDPTLFGDQSVESTADNNKSGLAEAFPFTGQTGGTARTINVYLDSHNKAGTLVAAIYSDHNGQPGSRLVSGSTSSPKAGAWNAISIASTAVQSSTRYWIAILGKNGMAYFRDRAQGPCYSFNSQQSSLTSLPSTWTSGSQWTTCPVSAYVTGSVTATVATVPTTTTTTTSSTTTTSATQLQLPVPPVMLFAPQISGTATQGQTLATDNGTWLDSPTSYSYQWQDCDTNGLNCTGISGATGNSYTLAGSDVGHTIRVVVTASNAGGSVPASSAQTDTVQPMPAPTNTAAPVISGTTTQGQTLSTSNGTWTGSPSSYSYQWQDCDTSGANCANISGAGSSSYAPTSGDVGNTLRVVVTATNAGGFTGAISNQTAVVQAPPPPPAPTNSALPAITGSTTQGQTLTASRGTWNGSPTSYAYQWRDCDSTGAGCTNISGATSSSYTLTSGDVADTIRVVVTASNAGGSTPATSNQTAIVQASTPAAPTNSALPSISGTTTQGQTLTAARGTWTGSPSSYAYQWRDCNSSGASCTNISGATGSTYTLAAGDVGDTIRVVVTATNAGGSTPATSNQTAVVQASTPAAPANSTQPAISGTTTQGQTLSTSNGTWTGSPTGYAYQWRDCDSSGANCTSISGATSNSYTLAAGDVGDTIRVVVTATNAGGSTPATSSQTAAVASSGGGGGGTQTNCLGTTGSNTVNYTSLDNCGYPSPNTTGVPAGTTLTSVSSINCSNQTINAVTTSGRVTIGSNCTITNSRLTGGQITIPSNITGVTLSHDEISGAYTGSPTSPSCTYSSTSGTSSDVLAEGAATAVTLNYDYLHCAAEPLNGNFQVSNSYIISDECWGPCGSGSTTHNEALYIAGGGSGGTKVQHNTILNEYGQTAGIFGDDHAYGPISNLTIDSNLVACGGDNGAISTGAAGDGNTGVSITNNRLSYVYSSSMPAGNSTASTWSGNYRDDNLQAVAANG